MVPSLHFFSRSTTSISRYLFKKVACVVKTFNTSGSQNNTYFRMKGVSEDMKYKKIILLQRNCIYKQICPCVATGEKNYQIFMEIKNRNDTYLFTFHSFYRILKL